MMAKRSWFPALLAPRPVRAKPLKRSGEVRVAAVNAPVDFNDDRARYEVEILNVDAVYQEPPARPKTIR